MLRAEFWHGRKNSDRIDLKSSGTNRALGLEI